MFPFNPLLHHKLKFEQIQSSEESIFTFTLCFYGKL